MAITQNTDVFIPQEVLADMAVDVLFSKTPLLNSGSAKDISNIVELSGEHATIPVFNTDNVGQDFVQNAVRDNRSGVTPTKIGSTSYTENLSTKVISVDADRFALRDAHGDLLAHLADVVAAEMASDVHATLVNRARQTPLLYSTAAATDKKLTVSSILRGRMVWAEHHAERAPVLLCSSAQFADLADSTDFKSLGSAATAGLVDVNMAEGARALVHGVRVLVSDTLPKQDSTISGIARSSSTATVTTAAAHNILPGDEVVISGATQEEYNGTHVVLTAPTATTFTYEVSGSPATPATGSPVLKRRDMALLLAPDSLGVFFKQVESQNVLHAGSSVVSYDTFFRYGATLRRIQPRGVVRVFTEIS